MGWDRLCSAKFFFQSNRSSEKSTTLRSHVQSVRGRDITVHIYNFAEESVQAMPDLVNDLANVGTIGIAKWQQKNSAASGWRRSHGCKRRHHSRVGVPIGAQSDYVKEFAMKGRNRQAYADGTYLGWNDKSDHLYECITDPTIREPYIENE